MGINWIALLEYLIESEEPLVCLDKNANCYTKYDLGEFCREVMIEGGGFKVKTERCGEVEVEVLADFGGGEGDGEERWIVYKVTCQDQYGTVRRNGAYYSYHGDEWDSFEEVSQYKVIKTEWLSAKEAKKEQIYED